MDCLEKPKAKDPEQVYGLPSGTKPRARRAFDAARYLLLSLVAPSKFDNFVVLALFNLEQRRRDLARRDLLRLAKSLNLIE